MEKAEILEAVRQYCREHHKKPPFQPGMRIQYAERVYDEEEIANLVDASLAFWLTAGRFTERFESGLAAFLQLPYVSLVNSGSSANLLAVAALTSPLLGERRVKRGDEIITVAAAFPTTVAPIVQIGAIPVFIDIDIPSYNVDPKLLERAYTKKTKAVVLAHSLGNPFNLAAVKAFCDRHGLWLVEDNCDALGATYEMPDGPKRTGTVGDLGTSSFYPAHQLTTGEGGAVYTKNPLLHKIVRSLRDWGRDCVCSGGQDNRCGKRFSGRYGTLPEGYDHKYVYSHLGYNLKATDLQAAIGVAQLEKLPGFVAKRRANWQYLRDGLEDVQSALLLPEKEPRSEPCCFGFILCVKESCPKSRDEIVGYLESRNVQTRNLFAGNILRHPCFQHLAAGSDYRVAGSLARTDRAMQRSFFVGVHPGLTKEMLDAMLQFLKESVRS